MIDISEFRADHLIKLFLGVLKFIKNYFLKSSYNYPSFLQLIIFLTSLIIFVYLLTKFWKLNRILKQQTVLLELTPPALTEKTAYTTQQLFSVLHHLGNQKTFWDRVLGRKVLFSFEIVSTKEKGIRYIVRTNLDEAHTIERTIVSYLPQIRVKQIEEYLPKNNIQKAKVIEFKLRKHYAFPLATQNVLTQHDPVAYITGMMTKLKTDELISFQVIVSPTKKKEAEILSHKILRNEDVLGYLNKPQIPVYLQPIILVFKMLFKLIHVITREAGGIITELAHGSSQQAYIYNHIQQQNLLIAKQMKPARVLSSFEQETLTGIQKKVDQELFETTIRALLLVNDSNDRRERIRGIKSSLAPFSVPKYQALKALYNFPPVIADRLRLFTFRQRLLSVFSNKSSSLLSVSEIADLYHFPNTQATKTENIVKAHSKELPAPLSLKSGRELQVVFGNNTYGNTITPIGLTKEERETHMYIIGRTGSGKTTLIFSMAKHDIENGQGIAFIDPHGDVSEDLLACIPDDRKDDLVYVDPTDLKHPIGINLLELIPGLDEDETEVAKEIVCEGVISLFRKVFSKEENANAHRIEYVLRNTIHTAFTVEGATIFTVYDLLTNPPFQQKVIKNLTDEYLQNFWKFEFGKAGDYQVVKMVSGVTAKVGRFLFSPMARRILEQKKSTINFDDLMNQGKILICNFSQGNLGEDTTRLLGTTILTKIQQAALRRARIAKEQRRPFYLYVDEFQNFATHSFIKMLSEGRKYGLSVTVAEQSTSQQEDRDMVHNILANVTTVVCFRDANPIDQELMMAQFAPYIEKGDIGNLPRYRFYIKISALESEEPFSGETIFIPVKKDKEKMTSLIEASRKNYASVYQRQKKKEEPKIEKKEAMDQIEPKAKGKKKPAEDKQKKEDKTKVKESLP